MIPKGQTSSTRLTNMSAPSHPEHANSPCCCACICSHCSNFAHVVGSCHRPDCPFVFMLSNPRSTYSTPPPSYESHARNSDEAGPPSRQASGLARDYFAELDITLAGDYYVNAQPVARRQLEPTARVNSSTPGIYGAYAPPSFHYYGSYVWPLSRPQEPSLRASTAISTAHRYPHPSGGVVDPDQGYPNIREYYQTLLISYNQIRQVRQTFLFLQPVEDALISSEIAVQNSMGVIQSHMSALSTSRAGGPVKALKRGLRILQESRTS